MGGEEAFRERVDEMIDELKRCPTMDDVTEILYPGELEWRREAKALRDGLDLPEATLKELERAESMVSR